MANINVTIRMDKELRREADNLFDDLGMSLNQAIIIFIKQAVREQRIPFSISRDIPNKETLKSFKEIEDSEKGKADLKTYNSVEELFDDVLKD